MARWRHMTWELRHGFQTAAILDPPSWILGILCDVRKPAKLTQK